MSTKTNQTEVQQEVEQVAEQTTEQNAAEQVAQKTFKSICKSLLENDSTKVQSVIRNINITEKDNYTMVSFTLGNKVDAFVSEDEGVTYKRGVSNIIYTSLYAVVATLKEDEELSWMANVILTKPTLLNLIFNGAKITFIQQFIGSGEEYVNPFTNQTNPEPTAFDHDVIINHVIGFKPSAMGQKMADKLADKMMSMAFEVEI